MSEQVVTDLVAKVGVHADTGGLEHLLGKLELVKTAIKGFIVYEALHKLYEMGESLAALGEGLETSAIQTGLTTDRLQELQYAASQNAVSADALTGAMSRLGRIMFQAQKGSKQAVDSFARLGISPEQVKGFKSLDDALFAVQDGIQGLSSQQEKLAVTQALFGRGGGKFLKFLEAGSDETKELMKRAQAVGAVIGENNVKALAEFEDASSSLKLVFRGFGANITGAFLPFLTTAMRAFESWWGGVQGKAVAGLTWFGTQFVYYGYVAIKFLGVFGEFLRRVLFGGNGPGGVIHQFLADTLGSVIDAGKSLLRTLRSFGDYLIKSGFGQKFKDIFLVGLEVLANVAERLAEFLGKVSEILMSPASPEDTFLVKMLHSVADAAGRALDVVKTLFQWAARITGDDGFLDKVQDKLLYGKGDLSSLSNSLVRSFDPDLANGEVLDRVIRLNTTRSLALPNLGRAMQQNLQPQRSLQTSADMGSMAMPVNSTINVYTQGNASAEEIAAAINRKQELVLPKLLAETKRDFQSQLRW